MKAERLPASKSRQANPADELLAKSKCSFVLSYRYGCFYKLGIYFSGVITTGVPLFGVYVMAPDVSKTPVRIILRLITAQLQSQSCLDTEARAIQPALEGQLHFLGVLSDTAGLIEQHNRPLNLDVPLEQSISPAVHGQGLDRSASSWE